MRDGYLAHVDGLRAVAVLIVIFFHLDVVFFPGGYIGVDIFFVISGFLITGILKSELESSGQLRIGHFYIKRIKRLMPALLVTMFVTFAFAALVFSPGHLQAIAKSLVSAILSISNFHFWIESDYFDTSAKLKPFLHTWSLSVEEQFYLIWPAALLLLYKFGLKRTVLPLLIIGILFSLFLNYKFADGKSWFVSTYTPSLEKFFNNGKSTLFFLLPFRIFEFAIGACLVWVYNKKLPWRFVYDLILLLGLGLIAYAILRFDNKLIFPYWYALIPCLGAALVIYAGKHAYIHMLLTNRLMVGTGLISYSLYLVHWPLIVFWHYLGNESGLSLNDKLMIFTLTFILSYLLYRFVETPFRSPNFFTQKPRWKFGMALSFCLLLSAGMHAYKHAGWDWRIGDPIVNLEEVEDGSVFHRKYYGGNPLHFAYAAQDPNRPTDIMITGDSHSSHYAYGLNERFSKAHGYNLYNGGFSCMHLPGITRIDHHEGCITHRDKALEHLKNLRPGSIVILSNAWNYQIPYARKTASDNSIIDETLDIEDILEKLNEFSKMIGDAQLVVIGDVPWAGASLYDVFTRPRPLMFNGFNPDDYLFKNRDPNIEATNNALRHFAETTNAYVFIDPFDYLCDEIRCRNTDEQKHLIYSDISHLSIYGSQLIIEAIEDRLLELLHKNNPEPQNSPNS